MFLKKITKTDGRRRQRCFKNKTYTFPNIMKNQFSYFLVERKSSSCSVGVVGFNEVEIFLSLVVSNVSRSSFSLT